MSDQDIIASLVKERERCRQLVQLYQEMWASPDDGAASTTPDPMALQTANRILTQVLSHLRSLPEKPANLLTAETDRQEARHLLREIGDLLERAIVAERETRERAVQRTRPPSGAVRNKAMQMYARA
ncbi:MAG: hypothetical protein V2A34_14825 [Lentisphaerota bacterium]